MFHSFCFQLMFCMLQVVYIYFRELKKKCLWHIYNLQMKIECVKLDSCFDLSF